MLSFKKKKKGKKKKVKKPKGIAVLSIIDLFSGQCRT